MSNDLAEIIERLEAVSLDIEAIERMEALFVQRHVELVKYNQIISPSPSIRPHMLSSWTMKVTGLPPVGLRSKIGTVANEMRSCLDELAYRLALRNNASEAELKKVCFPIVKSEEEFKKFGLKTRISMLNEVDRRKIELIKPWKTENDILFQLSVIDNMRKHQRLMACLSQSSGFSPGMVSIGEFSISGGVSPEKVNKECQIATGVDVFGELDFIIRIEFREPPDVKGKRVVELIKQIHQEVRFILDKF